MKFHASTNNDRKLNVNWDLVNQYVARWKPNTKLEFSITRAESKVSDPMRKYYYVAVLPPLAEHAGYERNEEELLHHQLKATYFKVEPDKFGVYKGVPSVFGNKSDIAVSIKAKFIDWVIRVAAKQGVIINDPMPGKE